MVEFRLLVLQRWWCYNLTGEWSNIDNIQMVFSGDNDTNIVSGTFNNLMSAAEQ